MMEMKLRRVLGAWKTMMEKEGDVSGLVLVLWMEMGRGV